MFEEGLELLVRLPKGQRLGLSLSPSFWKEEVTLESGWGGGGAEKTLSSDLRPEVAIGYVHFRDGFCYRGTPTQDLLLVLV